MPKSRGRGRKRKASPSPDAEDNSGVAGVKETIVSTNRGKYVPRFGNAAKKQRVDVGGKKLNREVSDEGEEDVLLPISSTQPVGGARDADMAGEWSSTQPAPKLATDVQVGH